MTRLALSVVAAVLLAFGASQRAGAQFVTWAAPAPVVRTAFFAPAAPVATVAPVAWTAASPVAWTVASPVAVAAPVASPCCAPAVAPAPVVTYYRAPQVVYQPTPTVVTRYRPILGGTVSRVYTTWSPVVY